MPPLPPSCDIFCTVIDNFGDTGVSWRLARQLAVEHGWRVRFWIDDPASLDLIAPDHPILPIEVHHWRDNSDCAHILPAQVVIETFGCELPPCYLSAMATRPRSPVWINLEYLSAEAWVVGCHELPSPHPTLPLIKYFFLPGFVAGTGGLLREKLLAVPPAPTFNAPLKISLFCYNNAALPALLDGWREGSEPIACYVAEGLPRQQVETWLGGSLPVGEAFPVNATVERGQLHLYALPFLSQTGYDTLLANCHLNFVRGEDSLVRAQWAERPFAWQAYPQSDNAHLDKLNALLALYNEKLEAQTATAVRVFWHAWNSNGNINTAWRDFRQALPALTETAPEWAQHLAAQGDLAGNLVNFCHSKL